MLKFCIITHVNHYHEQNQYFAYAPYVREMNLWYKYVDKVIIVAPADKKEKTVIDLPNAHHNIAFKTVPSFDVTTFKNTLRTVIALPYIIYMIFVAMKEADHIHLRCAGNMALLGCFVQILFPKKKKTAKYAGNWDPKADESFSISLQKWLLNNTFLTKNMKVMVYGEWEGSSKNVKSFFTATYTDQELASAIEEEKKSINRDERNSINRNKLTHFLFVGTLTSRKRPNYAIDIVELLCQKGYNVQLSIIGEGEERYALEAYIAKKKLSQIVSLKGNKSKDEVAQIFKKSEFVLLPSKIEGWPKVVAEAMFWGCIPVSTPISCVPYMLDKGNRGVLLTLDLEKDVNQLMTLIDDENEYRRKAEKAKNWSRQFTVEKFEEAIRQLLV